MPIERNEQVYYRTTEACQEAGISRATLFRWVSDGVIADAGLRDKNGWRLFTGEEIAAIRARVMSQGKEALGARRRRGQRRTVPQR